MEYTAGSIVFDDWVIDKIIGQGSYGSVYKIHKSEYGVTTYSALKVIKIPQSSADIRSALSEGMDNQTVTSYFQGIVDDIVHEIAIMAQLKSHPNIVSYEDHKIMVHQNEIGWDILIRMELLTGLIDYQLSHQITEQDIRKLAIDISEALTFCQRKGLIHRDIKPENIFVSEAGSFKIGDFGVAKTAEKAASVQSRKGTEIYMAPEVYMGKPYAQNVDIYSLGLVLYKFLNNNRLPFYPEGDIPIRPGDRENALIERMKGTPLPRPVHGSEGLCKIVLKACQYNPAMRYQTAGKMLQDLKAITDGPDPYMYRQQKNTTENFGNEQERTTGIFGNPRKSAGSDKAENKTQNRAQSKTRNKTQSARTENKAQSVKTENKAQNNTSSTTFNKRENAEYPKRTVTNPFQVWMRYLPSVTSSVVSHYEIGNSISAKGLQYVKKRILPLQGETIIGIVYGSIWTNPARLMVTDKTLYISFGGNFCVRYDEIRDVNIVDDAGRFSKKIRIVKRNGQISEFPIYRDCLNLKPLCEALLLLKG